jgi:hypothetical protein
VEGPCEHGSEPSGSIKCWEILEGCATGFFSRRAELHGVSWLGIRVSYRSPSVIRAMLLYRMLHLRVLLSVYINNNVFYMYIVCILQISTSYQACILRNWRPGRVDVHASCAKREPHLEITGIKRLIWVGVTLTSVFGVGAESVRRGERGVPPPPPRPCHCKVPHPDCRAEGRALSCTNRFIISVCEHTDNKPQELSKQIVLIR